MSLLGNVLGAVSSVANATASLFNTKHTNKTNQRINDQTNQTNLQIARENNEANYNLWKEQLAYNDPTAQMDRLRRAGLNPQLALGNMQNVATDRPTMQGATMQSYQYQPYDINQMLDGLFKGEQFKQLLNQTKKSNAEARLADSQADIAETQSAMNEMLFNEYLLKPEYIGEKMRLEQEHRWLNNQIAQQNITNQIIQRDISSNQANLILKQIEKESKEIEKLSYENKVSKYRSILAEANVNPDSKGIDYLVDALVKNPEIITESLSNLIKESMDLPTKSINKLFNFNFAPLSENAQKVIKSLFNQKK